MASNEPGVPVSLRDTNWADLVLRCQDFFHPIQAGRAPVRSTWDLCAFHRFELTGRVGKTRLTVRGPAAPPSISTCRHTDTLQLQWVPVLIHDFSVLGPSQKRAVQILRVFLETPENPQEDREAATNIHIPFFSSAFQPNPSSAFCFPFFSFCGGGHLCFTPGKEQFLASDFLLSTPRLPPACPL